MAIGGVTVVPMGGGSGMSPEHKPTNYICDDLTARDALILSPGAKGSLALVKDASEDPTVESGWAVYSWDGEDWTKIAESEGLEVDSLLSSYYNQTEIDGLLLSYYNQTEVDNLIATANIEVIVDGVHTYYDTFDAAITFIKSLNEATTEGVVVNFSPGTYETDERCGFNAYDFPITFNGNGSTLIVNADFGVFTGSEVRHLNITASGYGIIKPFISAKCLWDYCSLTGDFEVRGETDLRNCKIFGNITYYSNEKVCRIENSKVFGQIESPGELWVLNTLVACTSTSPAINSTDGTLVVQNSAIYNDGGGGDISCDNGASVPDVNMMSSVKCLSGGIACGTSVTILGTHYVNTDVSGSAILHEKLETQYESLAVNIPGTLDTTSTTALASLANFPMIWNLLDATLVEVKAKVLTAVSTGTAPAVNVILNGVNALSSDLSVNETLATGTIDTSNDTIASGQTIEIDFDKGNGDAENLVVYLKFQLA